MCVVVGVRVRARPHLIHVYPHPTPVAAEIILRHSAFFFPFFPELIAALPLQRVWQSSRDKEREGAYVAYILPRRTAETRHPVSSFSLREIQQQGRAAG